MFMHQHLRKVVGLHMPARCLQPEDVLVVPIVHLQAEHEPGRHVLPDGVVWKDIEDVHFAVNVMHVQGVSALAIAREPTCGEPLECGTRVWRAGASPRTTYRASRGARSASCAVRNASCWAPSAASR